MTEWVWVVWCLALGGEPSGRATMGRVVQHDVSDQLASNDLAEVVRGCLAVGDEGLVSFGPRMLELANRPPAGPWRERVAVSDAALDALIRLRHPVPAVDLMDLACGHHRTHALILASHDIERHRRLLRRFLDGDASNEEWTAAANLLVSVRDVVGVEMLLSHVRCRDRVKAIGGLRDVFGSGGGSGGVGGRAGGLFRRRSTREFPMIPLYDLSSNLQASEQTFAPGPIAIDVRRTMRRLERPPAPPGARTKEIEAHRALALVNSLATDRNGHQAPPMQALRVRSIKLIRNYGATVQPLLAGSRARWSDWADGIQRAVPGLQRHHIPPLEFELQEVGQIREVREERVIELRKKAFRERQRAEGE